MQIEPFKVEIWMNEWETQCTYNLAETCVASITVEELLALSGGSADDLSGLLQMKLTYGDIEGSPRLRTAIANLYANQCIEDITVTHGTIAANMLVHKAIVEPGDHVLSIVPTYQQHYSIPKSIQADVTTLALREEDGFLPNLEALKALVKPNTKLIAFTNPNNPTGALIERPMLEDMVDIADSVGAYLLCDEVYRGTAQVGDGMSPSIVDLYAKGISTAGMSKVFSLAGLRVGWVIAPQEVREQVLIHRDYDTISVGMINDHFAAIALEHADEVLARSHEITRGNLALLEAWIAKEPKVSWVKPRAGTTAMLKLNIPVTAREFCIDLVTKTGVMLTPGDAFDMEGYARIGFANDTQTLTEGLAALSEYLATHYST
ncbi:aminotransferase [Candidatus Paraluminiphilus aquimaris]|uniref:Aminotransferase n=1 Tax=Candidatus Paraluminiphilus aquimaris TaxID=2518994 RepID=A0ABY6Q579_9GAMM|nr:aminotransferase [Candidatus Paraluminiphilus aquimaris]UZP73443.1 aminotransferase [Candidatus Paraluminiphilus aquimaris]